MEEHQRLGRAFVRGKLPDAGGVKVRVLVGARRSLRVSFPAVHEVMNPE